MAAVLEYDSGFRIQRRSEHVDPILTTKIPVVILASVVCIGLTAYNRMHR
jgi:hypothetical protein